MIISNLSIDSDEYDLLRDSHNHILMNHETLESLYMQETTSYHYGLMDMEVIGKV